MLRPSSKSALALVQQTFDQVVGRKPRRRTVIIGVGGTGSNRRRPLDMISAEQLESRILLAAVSDNGTDVLTIDLNMANEQLQIESRFGEYHFESTANFAVANASDPANQGAAFVGFGTNLLTLTEDGLEQYTEIRITDSVAGTSVVFKDSGIFEYSDAFTVLLNSGPAPAATIFEGRTSFSDHALHVTVGSAIQLLTGTQLVTRDGGITLSANVADTSVANHHGVELIGSTISTTGTGNISITGHGGNNAGANGSHGIRVGNNSLIESTLNAMNAGTISLFGVGSPGVSNNYGMHIVAGGTISSVSGDIQLNGQGGTGTGDSNYGVVLLSGATVRSTGLGANAANIVIDATANANTTRAVGFVTNDATLETWDGNISVTGRSLDTTGQENTGVQIVNSRVESLGTGASAGAINLQGFGGGGTTFNEAVDLGNSVLQTVDGDINIAGTGGIASQGSALGVLVRSTTRIVSLGDGDNAGNITITGTGGNGGINNYGVNILNDGTLISSIKGGISLMGVGGGGTNDGWGVRFDQSAHITSVYGDILLQGEGAHTAGNRNYGIRLTGNSRITSTGNGPEAATITLNGTSGNSGGSVIHGLFIESGVIESVDGDIQLTGIGGTAGSGIGYGISLKTSRIISQGRGEFAANIFLNGTGANGSTEMSGVVAETTRIETIDGDITVTGQAGNGAGSNYRGTYLFNGTTLRTNSTSMTAGAITITGIGGNGGSTSTYNSGVEIVNLNTSVSTLQGPITITGTGGNAQVTSGSHMIGVHISNAEIRSFGAGPQVGAIQITGTGGISNVWNDGVRVWGLTGVVKSIDADISLNGTGYGTAGVGINVWVGGYVGSIGSGDVVLTGHGGEVSTSGALGIAIGEFGGTTAVHDGNLTLTGTGGNNGTAMAPRNVGVIVKIAGRVLATGTGSILVDGTGGDTGSENAGVWIQDQSTIVSAVEGTITITGTGGPDGEGVRLVEDMTIKHSGMAEIPDAIIIVGHSGNSATDRNGVLITGSNTSIQTLNGDVNISGFAHGMNTIPGIAIMDAILQTQGTGEISLNGTGPGPDVTAFGHLTAGQSRIVLTPETDLNATAKLSLSLGGDVAGVTHGQFVVQDTLSLAGAMLSVTLAPGYMPNLGDEFKIVDVQGTLAGTFSGLPEGELFFVEGKMFRISYQGGDGNDVVLKHVDQYENVLNWNSTTGAWSYGVNDGTQFVRIAGPVWNPAAGWDIHYGDFNGDQRLDAAGRTAAGAWHVVLATDAGLVSQPWGQWGSNAAQVWRDVLVGDFNGDGYDDITGRNWRGEQYVSVSDGDHFLQQYWGRIAPMGWVQSVAGDFNGDGLDDIANFQDTGNWWLSESNGLAFTLDYYATLSSQASAGWQNILVGDFNGDGSDDVIQQTATGQWWIADGDHAAGDGHFTLHYANTWNAAAFTEVQVGDFNGDGRDDLLGRTAGNQLWVNRSLISGRMQTEYWGAWGATLDWTTHVGDFNRDGLDDFAGLNNNGMWYVQISTGTNFQNQFFGPET